MNPRVTQRLPLFPLLVLLALPTAALAQRGGRGQAPQPTVTAKAGAAVDLTGYWVSVVTEDWQFRMVTAPRGNYSSVNLSAEGRRLADQWDPAKDEASGNQCRGYGAGGIMRIPGRLHITWDNDNTLHMDIDAGTQTRIFHFDNAPAPAGDLGWQGYSTARWEYATGQRANTPASERTGSLKATTTKMRPGYVRRNGVPYSANAVINETYQVIKLPNGDDWIILTTIIEDPQYLSQPFITTTNFKKLPGAAGWNPTPCSAS